MHNLTLRGGDWEASLLPEAGGILTSLRCGGVEVLRNAPAGSTDPLEASCFPLVPYANRIAGGRFSWLQDDVHLPQNFAPETSSIHGIGWESSWQVSGQSDFKCALDHSYDGLGPRPWKEPISRWPWAYHAQQRVRLGPKGCAITLNLTNLSNVPMPAGLGLHPYFRRRPETKVQFKSNGIVMVGDDLIPNGQIAASDHFADFAAGSLLPGQLVDHCFMQWDGTARIEDDLGTIEVTAIGAPFLHVYAPEDGSALCLEPVSHMPDAPNQDPAGITSLPPGCSATLQLMISAAPVG